MSPSSIWWNVLWAAVTVAGLTGVVATTNSMRFQRRLTTDVRRMLAEAGECETPDTDQLQSLPAPVRRYLTKAIGNRRGVACTARLRQIGTFRPDLKGNWYPIASEQYFTADPPSFVWWGRLRLAPGIWIDARDRSLAGAGNMLVLAESTITLANAVGPELDQGALLRLLGELSWLPTTYLDSRYVRWSAVDDRKATATLSVGGRTAAGVFEFGDNDLPVRFTADRFRDVGEGKSVLTPFVGECSDYREVGGFLVPHTAIGSWVIDGVSIPYARFHAVGIDFNSREPY